MPTKPATAPDDHEGAVTTGEEWPPRFPDVPDFLGRAARQRGNAEAIFNGQGQRDAIVREIRMYGKKPDDTIIGTNPSETYSERLATLDKGLKDTWAEVKSFGEDEMKETQKEIDKYLDQNKRVYDASLKQTPTPNQPGAPPRPPQ